MRISIISFAFAALVSLLGAAAAHAQGITLTPAVVPLAGSYGQSVTQALTLQNDTDFPLDFTMEARDVVVRDGARLFVEAGQLADSIAANAVFSPRELRVAPHASGTATVTLTLPPAVRHRAVVVCFRGTTPVPSGGRQALLSLGSLLTFTISDHVSIAAGKLEADPPSANASTRLKSTLVNDGEEPVMATGMAVILDAGGRLAGKAPFAARRLLPGEKATLVADYQGELRAGSYRTVATLAVAGRPLTLTGSLNVP
jgi:hypothetical protein